MGKVASLCMVAAAFFLLVQTAAGKQVIVLFFVLAGASLGMALFLVLHNGKTREE